ncbi:hypothetical protein [Neptunicoccus cionae]|uniref:hypothetical protein n=1 Tax=Neptunicoccus cionae TaxID=2035344 RepID=UPI000C774BCB|nr:hypothetical protein [Amylibacter cionae]PLS22517.1 hypothetical protein C0U40_08905 [Amylibacter cionae]
MQITATLDGSTATIATNHCGISTSMSVTDAANLAKDLAAFTDPDAPSVDRSTPVVRNLKQPPFWGPAYWGPGSFPGYPLPEMPHPGFYRDGSAHVSSRGYWLDATDDGVRITDPATNGKLTIPRDQIAAVIAGLNA